MKKIAIFGGSFNPPGIHHEAIVKALSECGHFDKVVVAVSGAYHGKEQNQISNAERIILCHTAFALIPNVIVDFYDLAENIFTPTVTLLEDYIDPTMCFKRIEFAFPYSEWYFVAGADLIKGGKDGQSEIQRLWDDGERLFREAKFAVLDRPGYGLDRADFPPHAVDFGGFPEFPKGSSTEIRNRLAQNLSISGLVSRKIEEIILYNRFYQSI